MVVAAAAGDRRLGTRGRRLGTSRRDERRRSRRDGGKGGRGGEVVGQGGEGARALRVVECCMAPFRAFVLGACVEDAAATDNFSRLCSRSIAGQLGCALLPAAAAVERAMHFFHPP